MLTSEPMRIGKHDWRIRKTGNLSFSGKAEFTYEFRRAETTVCGQTYAPGYWKDQDDWPRYDHNNGMHGGMPKTLRKLWEANRDFLQTV